MVTKIALCGRMRSGKDTVAEYLIENHGFKSFRFSEGIWATIELLYPEIYEKSHEEKPRKLLQVLGQKLRESDPDVWVNFTLRQIVESNAERIVITDVRQPNEFQILKEKGFSIVRVHADTEIRIARAEAASDNFNMQDLIHETEKHVDSFNVDYEIINNGTLDELIEQTKRMYTALL